MDTIVLPYRGEFGHKLMWHFATVHALPGKKLIYAESGDEPFYPSAEELRVVPAIADEKRRQRMSHDKEFIEIFAKEAQQQFPAAKLFWPGPGVRKYFVPRSACDYRISCDVAIAPRFRPCYGKSRNWAEWARLVAALQEEGHRVFLVGRPDASVTDIDVPAAWDYDDYTSASIEALCSAACCVCTDSGVGYLSLWCATPVIMITTREGWISAGHRRGVNVSRFQGVNHKKVSLKQVPGSWERPQLLIPEIRKAREMKT